MRFEKEINIYGDEAVLKRFQANETSIAVVQGNISALISESELEELESSHATMYSKLASAVMDIESLTLNFSDLTTKYNTVSGQYTELDSKVAQYKAGVDGLEADITAVQQNLSQNYSTTTAMNAAITAKANEISAELSAVQTNLQNNYSTTTQMNAAINAKANEISLSVSSQIAAINGDITQMSAAITTNAENIALRVAKGEVISEINQSSDTIYLRSNRLVIQSTDFQLTEDGKIIVDADNFKIDSSGNVFVTGSGYFNGTFDVSIPYLNLGDYIIDFDSGVITMGLRLDDSDDPELPPASSITIGQLGCAFNSGSNLDLYAAANVTIRSGGYGDIEFTGADVYFSNDIDVSGEMRIAGDINSQGGINTYGNVNVDADFYSLSVPENGNRNDSNGMGQPGRAVVTDLNHFVCFEWITYMGTNWLNGFVDVTSLGGVQFNQ